MSGGLLEVRGLRAGYGAAEVLFGVDLKVARGEALGLLGRNGMGKSTLVKTIMGLVAARGGRISFGGRDITALPAHRRARLGIGYVPEGRQIFPNLTVGENLMATARPVAGGWTRRKVEELFPELAERASSMGALLSGGEQQMLAIARALMTNPKLLILDEATEGLAPLIRARIWEALARAREAGVALLVIDKNVGDLARLAERHAIMEKGEIAWSGDSAALRGEGVSERYLGV